MAFTALSHPVVQEVNVSCTRFELGPELESPRRDDLTSSRDEQRLDVDGAGDECHTRDFKSRDGVHVA